MLFELREYRTRPGKREEWVKVMEEEIIPFQMSKGVVVAGSFVGEEDDLYVLIRLFANYYKKKRIYEAVYESEYWKNEMGPRVPAYIDREKTVVRRLEPTSKSVIR